MNRILTPSTRATDILDKIPHNKVAGIADYAAEHSRLSSIATAHDEVAVEKAKGKDVLRVVHTDTYTYSVKILYFFGTENELLEKLGVAEVMLT